MLATLVVRGRIGTFLSNTEETLRMDNRLIFGTSTKGPFINYATHLGGEGVAIVLRNVTEVGLTEVL